MGRQLSDHFIITVLFVQSESDLVTLKAFQGDARQAGDGAEYDHNSTTVVTNTVQQQDLITKAITDALRSPHVNNLIVCATQETLDRQEGNVTDMITKALQLVWYTQRSTEVAETMEPSLFKDTLTSVIRNEVPFRRIYDFITLGINELLPSGELNSFLMDSIKELLTSGGLDSVIQEGVTSVLLSQENEPATVAIPMAGGQSHSQETAMTAEPMAAPSRQLEGILLDIFDKLVICGELDDILVSAVSERLQSGKLDGIISKYIAFLEKGVELAYDIATIHLMKSSHIFSVLMQIITSTN